MSKRHRLRLKSTPVLITKISAADWLDGVLLLPVNSGDDRGTLALSPHMALQLYNALGRSLAHDPASPLTRPRNPRAEAPDHPAEKESKP